MNTLDLEREQRMDEWEHRQACRERDETIGRIRHTLHELYEKVGSPPRKLRGNRVVIERKHDGSGYQVYLPDVSVAGEGRCVCEASLEAFQQLETILLTALEYRDWGVLPTADRRVRVAFSVAKTNFHLFALRFMRSRTSTDEIEEAESVKSVLAATL